MNIFIVFAHPEPLSFGGALKNEAVSALTGAGHAVEVSDLYRMDFEPRAGAGDFQKRKNPGYLKIGFEQDFAYREGLLSPDIVSEQEKLRRADAVIFVFPLWWFSVPAILKGWFDRVLTVGFSYGGGMWYDTGGLVGKRAMLALTTGGPLSIYQPRGLNGDINALLWPIVHGTLHFVGFTVLEPFIAYGAMHAPDELRAEYLSEWRKYVLALDSAPVIERNPLSDYGEGFVLKEGVEMIRPF